MLSPEFTIKKETDFIKKRNPEDFFIIQTLGKGTFSKV